ncbi:hypothetical protein [Couchioplanes azureus]|uniref:hypothetical protein n=1 Tax=Couchioplanes caeruleus TaxID=56438 RepID=UPI00166FCDB5|nr:hypothetical protein [Couchioplanes caeruleus]GGQ63855.1 hypothetical protein GCM10010166_37100 [Couchioplanes caeruleus subsp. azureus]
MPADFSVPVDPDDLARQDLAAALDVPSVNPGEHRTQSPAHHGAKDERQAARERSGRARSGRAATAGGTRSYAFRRS